MKRKDKQSKQTQKAPISERPTQSDDTTDSSGKSTAEAAAAEAVRRGLACAGIDHDSWDFVGERVLNSLRSAGLLQPDFGAIVRGVEPEARVRPELHVHCVGLERTLAKAQAIAAAVLTQYGGHAEAVWSCNRPTIGCVEVKSCGTAIYVYCYRFMAEVPR